MNACLSLPMVKKALHAILSQSSKSTAAAPYLRSCMNDTAAPAGSSP